MRRLNLDEVVDCVGATVNLFTYTGIVGQRVFVPVRAATDVMYFATEENNTQLRIFMWAENAAAPSQFLRTVSASNHVNPDCRGGLNNTDWIERTTSWAILGFRMRGAIGRSFSQSYVAWYWNVAQDATHAQAYVHGAVFDARTLALLAQPNISSSTTCFGYPDVNGNSRGDLAMSIASGGRRFGGGPAVQGYIGMDDEFTIGIGNFSPFALVAAGTHNPPDARYGDYVNVSVHEPCDLAFTATAYALQNGTAAANVNRRYVEFVRGRYLECYTSRRNSSRVFP